MSVLFDRHGPDVTHSSFVEISRSEVMNRVLVPPLMKRGKRQKSRESSQNLVLPTLVVKRPVRAIMKNHEDPEKEAPC